MNITVKRTVKLLELTAQAEHPLSFGFLRENLFDVTPAGLSRLLKDLSALGWIEKNGNGLYEPGGAMRKGAARLVGRVPFAERIRPVVERLAERSGQSATFVEYDKGAIVHRAKKEMVDSMHYSDEGDRNGRVLYNTMGRLCLAWQERSEIERIFSLAEEERRIGQGENSRPQYLSSVENDSAELILSYRDLDIYVNFEPGMRTRICTALAVDGAFAGVMGITVPGAPLSDREELFFRKCVAKAVKEIDL